MKTSNVYVPLLTAGWLVVVCHGGFVQPQATRRWALQSATRLSSSSLQEPPQRQKLSSDTPAADKAPVVVPTLQPLTSTQQQQQQQPQASPEAMRHDIEEMRQEALQRLKALTVKMEQLKHYDHQHSHDSSVNAAKIPTKNNNYSLDSMEGDIMAPIIQPLLEDPPRMPVVPQKMEAKQQQQKQPQQKQPLNKKTTEPAHKQEEFSDASFIAKEFEAAAAAATAEHLKLNQNSHSLLADTRWKIVFSIGREAGTWMPKEWGASGERLRFHVVVDMTDDPLYSERDEFFQGVAGIKKLQVHDAWMFPTGVGNASQGRRPVKVNPVGGFKIHYGQGPKGTDIVRLYVDLLEDVRGNAASDVYCPAGRLYGTCGFFLKSETQKLKDSQGRYWKDVLAAEHHAAVVQLEYLQQETNADTRFFSLDQVKRMRQIYKQKKVVEELAQKLKEARQREPEKAQLRFARKKCGTLVDSGVALSKEGGVCCKVRKGLALEYHILGRMELASVEMREDANDEKHHDDTYEVLVHELHP